MNELCREFEENISKYSDFKIKAESLIREILIQNNLPYHKIESRIKNSKRLDEKIQRKSNKYSQLNDITDLVGIRIITFYEDEVDKIAEIIEKEFIKDFDNSVDKRVLDNDKFGYRSLHYVVSLSDERKKLTEYSRFCDLKIEIQIRSILQHAWAEIEHDIGYKGEFEIPDEFKRNFYRVAALLETADIEFLNIKKGLENYEKNIKKVIKTDSSNVKINLASVKAYVQNSIVIQKIDDKIAEKTGRKIIKNTNIDLKDLKKLHYLEVNTVKELDMLLAKYEDSIPNFAKEWINNKKGGDFHTGISIFYLSYLLCGLKGDLEFASKYYTDLVMNGFNNNAVANANRIIEIAKKSVK